MIFMRGSSGCAQPPDPQCCTCNVFGGGLNVNRHGSLVRLVVQPRSMQGTFFRGLTVQNGLRTTYCAAHVFSTHLELSRFQLLSSKRTPYRAKSSEIFCSMLFAATMSALPPVKSPLFSLAIPRPYCALAILGFNLKAVLKSVMASSHLLILR